MADGYDCDPAVGERTDACAVPWVDAPADPRGGFQHNPPFSMIRTVDNGAVVHSDGTADQRVLG